MATARSSDGSSSEDWVLIVDDEESVRVVLKRLVERYGFQAEVAGSVQDAQRCLKGRQVALVLADVNMPGGSGMELLEHIHENHEETATVMVTGLDDRAMAARALDMGAYGYVIKPFEANEIMIAVVNAMKRRDLEIENKAHRDRLEEMVAERTSDLWAAVSQLEVAHQDVRKSQEDTVYRLSLAAEFRDDETARHIQRMSRYCAMLAYKISEDAEWSELLRLASIMHDVGKIGIQDSILLKPGPLTPEERAVMETHPEVGYGILVGSESELLQLAASIAYTHHERLDGTGYPRGLTGDELPIEGRIAAIADVFDALSTDRVYRKAYPLGQTIELMRGGRGTHFDPTLLDTFLDSMPEVLQVKEDYDEGPGKRV